MHSARFRETVAGQDPTGITTDSAGRFAYVQNVESGTISIHALDASSGAITPAGTVDVPGVVALALRAPEWIGGAGGRLLTDKIVASTHVMTRENLVRSIRQFRRAARWLGACPGLLLGASPAAAQSCPCPAFKLPAVVKQADVIFVGKSLSATNDSTAPTGGDRNLPGVEFQTRLLFDVETVVKGQAPRFVEVVTPTAPCGFPFAVGKTYLVVGKRQGGALSTDACQGNTAGDDAIDDRVDAIRDELHR